MSSVIKLIRLSLGLQLASLEIAFVHRVFVFSPKAIVATEVLLLFTFYV